MVVAGELYENQHVIFALAIRMACLAYMSYKFVRDTIQPNGEAYVKTMEATTHFLQRIPPIITPQTEIEFRLPTMTARRSNASSVETNSSELSAFDRCIPIPGIDESKSTPGTPINIRHERCSSLPMDKIYLTVPGQDNGLQDQQKRPSWASDLNQQPEMNGPIRREKVSSSPLLLNVDDHPYERKTSWAFNIAQEHINVNLYKQEEKDDPSNKLCFSLKYEKERQVLVVHLLQGSGFKSKRPKNSTPACYAKVTLLPNKSRRYTSKVQRHTANPVFNQRFEFPISSDQLKENAVKFTLYDYDRFKRKVVMGYVVCMLRDFPNLVDDQEGTTSTWLPLTESIPDHVSSGEMSLSLCYDPQGDTMKVGIQKTRNLNIQSDHVEKDSSVYVKVTALEFDRPFRTCRTRAVRANSRHPAFDEFIEIQMPPPIANNICLVISACLKLSLAKTELLGKFTLGPFVMTAGEKSDHWSETLRNPRQTITKWHCLCS